MATDALLFRSFLVYKRFEGSQASDLDKQGAGGTRPRDHRRATLHRGHARQVHRTRLPAWESIHRRFAPPTSKHSKTIMTPLTWQCRAFTLVWAHGPATIRATYRKRRPRTLEAQRSDKDMLKGALGARGCGKSGQRCGPVGHTHRPHCVRRVVASARKAAATMRQHHNLWRS